LRVDNPPKKTLINLGVNPPKLSKILGVGELQGAPNGWEARRIPSRVPLIALYQWPRGFLLVSESMYTLEN
jgi:hypothetical protein